MGSAYHVLAGLLQLLELPLVLVEVIAEVLDAAERFVLLLRHDLLFGEAVVVVDGAGEVGERGVQLALFGGGAGGGRFGEGREFLADGVGLAEGGVEGGLLCYGLSYWSSWCSVVSWGVTIVLVGFWCFRLCGPASWMVVWIHADYKFEAIFGC